jgi:glutamate formiminotransferase/formiminotetrahydrofolate cyclodeaminase
MIFWQRFPPRYNPPAHWIAEGQIGSLTQTGELSVQPLVECVPNFSEGRRPEVIEALASAVRGVPGVSLLDVSSDSDHNRTVLTFVGIPEAVETAAFAAIKTAAEHIDLAQHAGQHPRIGAADVVPFVPLRGVQMADCVEMARRLGKRVGEELDISVYLYEQAAARPERQKLENIRQGGYEELREAIKSDPERAPDFGPAELGSAGATAIGARSMLIAYNIYLNTDDVEAAREIACGVRFSGGGLRYVKALGLLVNGQAQVSMNLTDFTATPIHRAQELVRVEAARRGYQITHAEVIGLVPEQVLFDAARWYLQLDDLEEEQILERRIRAVETANARPDAFVDQVASGAPVPGGGAVAALAGALAAALAGMVARTTLGKKKYAAVDAAMRAAAGVADELRAMLAQAMDDDGAAYERVIAAYRLSQSNPARGEAIQIGLRSASEVPVTTARLALRAMEQLAIVAAQGNIHAAADAATGVHMALAAIEGAAISVLTNLRDITDQDIVNTITDEIVRVRQAGRKLASEILAVASERIGIA